MASKNASALSPVAARMAWASASDVSGPVAMMVAPQLSGGRPVISSRAIVTSATPLSEAYCQKLQRELEAITGKKVLLVRKHDPSLIAGVVGAIGAFGVLLAFGAGGKPYVVMSIVFAGAPIVNVLYSLYNHPPKDGWAAIKPPSPRWKPSSRR